MYPVPARPRARPPATASATQAPAQTVRRARFHAVIAGAGAAQDCYLAYALTEMAGSTVMIFTRTCESTRKIALTLRNLGFGAIPIHGQMSQPKRLGSLNKFKVARLASLEWGTGVRTA